MIPIECEYGQPNCMGGLMNWGGHIVIPGGMVAPGMAQIPTGGGMGSGVLNNIIQTIQQTISQPLSAMSSGAGAVTTACTCPPASSGKDSCSCITTQAAPGAGVNAGDLLERVKAFAQAHPIASLAVVGGVGYVIFGKKKS